MQIAILDLPQIEYKSKSPMQLAAKLITNTIPSHILNILFNSGSRKGSDKRIIGVCMYIEKFNPRSRKGSDYCFTSISLDIWQFQSSLPRGERQKSDMMICSGHSYFNPRSREGSDTIAPTYDASTYTFQSSLPRGERLCYCRSDGYYRYISILAPARGAT